jgi:ubiquitin-conjugating enzyme E2 Q
MIFTRSEGVPSEIAAALEGISALSVGLRIPDLVVAISRKLQSLLAVGGIDDPILVSDGSDVEMLDITEEPGIKERQEEEDNNLDESEDEVDYGGFSSDEERGPDNKTFGSITHHISPEAAKKANRRIRQDLRAARNAGFSVGILNGMKADSVSSLVSLSIRVSKLGVSEEAVQAWDLEPHAYIVLLIRYSNGYKPFENVMHEPVQSMNVEFRIGVCDKYKPTLVEALATFTDVSKRNHKSKETGDKSSPGDNATDPNSGFTNMFISSSLNDFLNTQFVSLLKIRFKIGVGWDGAKKYLSDKQGRMGEDAEDLLADYYQEENHTKDILPEVTTADHLTDSQVKDISFPLIVAQFMLRYLTRCTEFCLVCHDKISEEFGALKPYVCNKPLCLYQYMSLGFGPSVEHEILTQPYVVDLLVSFCYASAMVSENNIDLSAKTLTCLTESKFKRIPNGHESCCPSCVQLCYQ